MRGYLVVTAHWIDTKRNWKLRSCVLEVMNFPSPHNTSSTSDMLLTIFEDLNLQTRVRAVTSDRGSEMSPAMIRVRQVLNERYHLNLEEDWHVRCICHIMNQAVVDAEKTI